MTTVTKCKYNIISSFSTSTLQAALDIPVMQCEHIVTTKKCPILPLLNKKSRQ